jgi:putative zinc finger protein
MTARCLDLDAFFDGELEADQAAAFRRHLGTCVRCQAVLHGRMQESVAAHDDDPVLARGSRRRVVERAPLVEEAVAPAPRVPAAAVTAKPDEPACISRRRRRTVLVVAPIVAVAAAVPLWLFSPTVDSRVVALDIEPGSAVARGKNAHIGDFLKASIRADHRAVWVYLDQRHLIVACPSSDLRCGHDGNQVTLRFSLDARGRYTIVALGPATAVSSPAPGQTLDRAMAALPATVDRAIRDVDVD